LEIYLFAENGSIVEICNQFLTETNYTILNQLGNSHLSDYEALEEEEAFQLVLVYAYTREFLDLMKSACDTKDFGYYSRAAKQYLKLKDLRVDIEFYNPESREVDYENVALLIKRWFQSQRVDFILKFKNWKDAFFYNDETGFEKTFASTLIMDVPALCRMFSSDNDNAIFLTGTNHTTTYLNFFEFMGFGYSLKQISKSSGLQVGAEAVEFLNSIISGSKDERCKTCNNKTIAYKCGASASCQYMYCSKACATQDWLSGHFNFSH
jgi:hypothetical protein